MNISMLHPAEQIVQIMKRLYDYQMTTTSGGNLSIMDAEGVLWISPSGIDKGTLTPADIMKVLPDGTIIGKHKPSSEYPFHLAIYKSRPDVRAVFHAHPPATVAFSLLRKIPATDILPDLHRLCPAVGIAKYAVPGSVLLGEYIADVFRQNYNIAMLENHGLVIGAKTLYEAFLSFEALDFAARSLVHAHTLSPNGLRHLTEAQLAVKAPRALPAFTPEFHSAEELTARKEMLALLRRAYDNRITAAAGASFSCILEDGSILITPEGKDCLYLEREGLVLVKSGRAEDGKTPSSLLPFHKAIYAKNPDIKAVFTAEPPYTMAFAITDAKLDGKLIPESYIMMKNVQRFPYDALNDPKEMAKTISIKEPIALVENRFVAACGTSLLNAFDRMEVCEYGARAVVDTAVLGEDIVAISPEEIHEIEVAFNL